MSALVEGEASRSTVLLRSLVDWAVNTEASSRSSALIRIGLAILFWSRWAGELTLFSSHGALELALSLNFFAATTMLFIGLSSRVAAAWAGVVAMAMYYYFGQQLGREPWTHHHTYLLAMAALLLALTPCGRSYSLDRYLAVTRAARERRACPAERGNVWGLRMIVIQMSVLYFYSAFDKTQSGFLSGARLEHIVLWFYAGSDYPAMPSFPTMAMLTAVAVVVLEYALAFGLPLRRTRRYLLPLGIAFHLTIYVTLPVYTFSATMLLLYLAYLDPDRVHRVIDRMQCVDGVPRIQP
ncbi:MAG: HTTM domain-containing protein [Rhizobiaceae bacterium]|nr:HTTM domain-containing protein [Rhizobiaceae bacterium]